MTCWRRSTLIGLTNNSFKPQGMKSVCTRGPPPSDDVVIAYSILYSGSGCTGRRKIKMGGEMARGLKKKDRKATSATRSTRSSHLSRSAVVVVTMLFSFLFSCSFTRLRLVLHFVIPQRRKRNYCHCRNYKSTIMIRIGASLVVIRVTTSALIFFP